MENCTEFRDETNVQIVLFCTEHYEWVDDEQLWEQQQIDWLGKLSPNYAIVYSIKGDKSIMQYAAKENRKAVTVATWKHMIFYFAKKQTLFHWEK